MLCSKHAQSCILYKCITLHNTLYTMLVLMYLYTITVLDSHLALSVVEERSSPATWWIVKVDKAW